MATKRSSKKPVKRAKRGKKVAPSGKALAAVKPLSLHGACGETPEFT